MLPKLRDSIHTNRWLASIAKAALRAKGSLFQRRACSQYLHSHAIRKLQIGCASNLLPGWLNTDIYPQSAKVVYLDATKRFPFADSTFDYVASEHQLEHITFKDGSFMLKECFRVLKPGGKIRIAVPSLDTLIELFNPDLTTIQRALVKGAVDNYFPEAGEYLPSFALNLAFVNWGHLFMYDMATLRRILENSGFTAVTSCPVSISSDPDLKGIEFRASGHDRFKTLVVEAIKPKCPVSPEHIRHQLVSVR